METGKVYKVRDKKSGLFSRGSRNGYMEFNKNGKAYSNIGHVKSMLKQFNPEKRYGRHTISSGFTFEDLEVVTYEVNEIETVDVLDILN